MCPLSSRVVLDVNASTAFDTTVIDTTGAVAGRDAARPLTGRKL